MYPPLRCRLSAVALLAWRGSVGALLLAGTSCPHPQPAPSAGIDLSTITDMVKAFDVDWIAGMSCGLVPLQTAPPKAPRSARAYAVVSRRWRKGW